MALLKNGKKTGRAICTKCDAEKKPLKQRIFAIGDSEQNEKKALILQHLQIWHSSKELLLFFSTTGHEHDQMYTRLYVTKHILSLSCFKVITDNSYL